MEQNVFSYRLNTLKRTLSTIAHFKRQPMFGCVTYMVDSVVVAIEQQDIFYVAREDDHSLFELSNRNFTPKLPFKRIEDHEFENENELKRLLVNSLEMSKASVKQTNNEQMSKLCKMPNMTRFSRRLLIRSGITTAEELKAVGPIDAYRKIKQSSDNVPLSILYILDGAVRGVHVSTLDQAYKEQLAKLIQE